MKKALLIALVALSALGIAACGDDDDNSSSSSATTEASSSDSSDSTEAADTGNADLDAYCDAVNAYVEKAKEVGNNPELASELATEAQELTTKAQALIGNLDASDVEKLSECQQSFTNAG